VAEVVVVDDGSTDKSSELLATVDDPRVTGLLQPHNMGKGARCAGGSRSRPRVRRRAGRGPRVQPEEFGVLLEPLEPASPTSSTVAVPVGSPAPGPVLLALARQRLLTLLSNMFTDLNLTDMETCYKVFRRHVIQASRSRRTASGSSRR
jgi:hypothetical protein